MKRHGTAVNWKVLLLTPPLLAILSAAQAEAPAREEGVALAEAMSVRPAAIAPAVLMPNAQVPPAPPALDAAVRTSLLTEAGLSAAGVDSAGEEFEALQLTAARPWFEDRAHLVITAADTVHPESSIRLPAGPPGQVALRMKVGKGVRYLVDFAVRGLGEGAYEIGADSMLRVVGDAKGQLQHVVAPVVAEADGWVTLRLSRRDTGFHLYSVSISRLP